MGKGGPGKGKYQWKSSKGDPRAAEKETVKPEAAATTGPAPKAGAPTKEKEKKAPFAASKPADTGGHPEDADKDARKRQKTGSPGRDSSDIVTATEETALSLGVTLDVAPGKLVIGMSGAISLGPVCETLFSAANGQRSDKVWCIQLLHGLADFSAYNIAQSIWMYEAQVAKISGVAGSLEQHPGVLAGIREQVPAIFMSNVSSRLRTRSVGKLPMKDATLVYRVGIPICEDMLDFVAVDAAGATIPYDLTVAGAALRHDVLQVNQRYHLGNLPNIVMVTFLRCYLADLNSLW